MDYFCTKCKVNAINLSLSGRNGDCNGWMAVKVNYMFSSPEWAAGGSGGGEGGEGASKFVRSLWRRRESNENLFASQQPPTLMHVNFYGVICWTWSMQRNLTAPQLNPEPRRTVMMMMTEWNGERRRRSRRPVTRWNAIDDLVFVLNEWLDKWQVRNMSYGESLRVVVCKAAVAGGVSNVAWVVRHPHWDGNGECRIIYFPRCGLLECFSDMSSRSWGLLQEVISYGKRMEERLITGGG